MVLLYCELHARGDSMQCCAKRSCGASGCSRGTVWTGSRFSSSSLSSLPQSLFLVVAISLPRPRNHSHTMGFRVGYVPGALRPLGTRRTCRAHSARSDRYICSSRHLLLQTSVHGHSGASFGPQRTSLVLTRSCAERKAAAMEDGMSLQGLSRARRLLSDGGLLRTSCAE